VSCAPTDVCVASDDNGSLLESTQPGGGAAAWTVAKGVDPAGFSAVACAPASLCAAADYRGSLATSTSTSTASAASAPGWSVTPQLGLGATIHPDLIDIACATPSLCVAFDSAGNALSTTRPGGPATGWTSTTINPGFAVNGGTCARTGFCAAVGLGGYVATSPGGAGGWQLADLDLHSIDNNGSPTHDALTSIGCASSALCVATRYSDGADNLEVSSNPSAGASSWSPRAVGQFNFDFFRAVACPARNLCVAGDAAGGTVAVSTDGGRHWKLTYVEDPAIRDGGSLVPGMDGVSCPTTRFCAVVDDAGHVITSRAPAGGSRAWHRARVDRGRALDGVSCASASLCAVIDGRGHVLVSSRPGGAASTWTRATVGSGASAVACPTTRLCLLSAGEGNVIIGRLRG
jgi:hypothetical protein